MGEPLALLGGTPAVSQAWSPEWPYVGAEEREAVTQVLDKRILSIYDRSGVILELENRFEQYHGNDGLRAIATSSGTAALHSAFFGIGLVPGDEVIVPTYTFLATVVPLLHFGAKILFADMDANSLNIDPLNVEKLVTRKTKAIVVTHMWGTPVQMTEIMAIADRHGLYVVEDCSHAHGATLDRKKVGTFGHVACFSLEGHKMVAAGEGGVLLTRDASIYERALMLGHFGRRIKDEVSSPVLRKYVETGFGHKFRIHPLGAAIAIQQLDRLDGRIALRKQSLERLMKLIGRVSQVSGTEIPIGATRGAWYGLKLKYQPTQSFGVSLETYMAALNAEGVLAKRPGSPPLDTQPIFNLSRSAAQRLQLPWSSTMPRRRPRRKLCDVAAEVYPRLISLPTFTGTSDSILTSYGAAFEKVASNLPLLHRWQQRCEASTAGAASCGDRKA